MNKADPYGHVSRSLYRAGWFRFGLFLARWLPRGLLRAGAMLGGRFYAWRHPEKGEVLRGHVAAVTLPENEPPAAAEIYASFAGTLADYFYTGSRDHAAIESICGHKQGYEKLKAAADAGKGALLATLHFSYFELGGWVLGRAGMPTVALTRPEPNPELTVWRAAFRARWGVETLEIGDDPYALLGAYGALTSGKMVAALIDRPHPKDRIAVDLPGGQVGCSAALLKIAAKAGSPILPLTVCLGRDGKYFFNVMDPVVMAGVDPKDGAALADRARELWLKLLPIARAHPGQYYQFEAMETE